MKEGIFICPQITQIFEDQDFSTKLYCTERRAWKAFENVCRNFLGNENAENYSEILLELISSYSSIGCNMSLKLHFLNYILDFFFPENMAAVSDELGEIFHQDISQVGKVYSGKECSNMFTDCCCSVIRETPIGDNKRQKKKK